LFVSLAGELEKSLVKEQLTSAERKTAIAEFKHLATVGGRIRSMVTRLNEDGFAVKGIDAFMRSLIRCRANADADEINATREKLARGEIKSRPIQELVDELQRRDNSAGR